MYVSSLIVLSWPAHIASNLTLLATKTNTTQPAPSHQRACNTTRSMAPKSKADAPVFTAETVACMIAVMELKGATLGTKAYQLMAKLDGTRTASGFEHQFRTVKARGKVLAAELSNETATPTAKTPKTPKTAKKPATASTKKRNSMFDLLEKVVVNLLTLNLQTRPPTKATTMMRTKSPSTLRPRRRRSRKSRRSMLPRAKTPLSSRTPCPSPEGVKHWMGSHELA
jgi:hypothetical protein